MVQAGIVKSYNNDVCKLINSLHTKVLVTYGPTCRLQIKKVGTGSILNQ